MDQFKKGDHLVTNIDIAGVTEHHGLYVGDDMVIHLTKRGIIEETILFLFSDGNEIRVKKSAVSPKQAIECARSKIGNRGYNAAINNCEQFVNECLGERKSSNQVSNVGHLSLQTVGRAGLLGSNVAKVATSTIGTVTLVSTGAKMVGEYVGLPDNVNTVMGAAGDMVGKPLETAVIGIVNSVSDTADCISCGEYGEAAGKLVAGTIMTGIETTFTLVEVGVDSVRAGANIVSNVWNWFWD